MRVEKLIENADSRINFCSMRTKNQDGAQDVKKAYFFLVLAKATSNFDKTIKKYFKLEKI